MRIILADHHTQVLWALKTTLQEEPGIDLIWLPGMLIGDQIATLHALKPKPIVIIMSSKSEDSRMALSAGADAFVSKADQPEWLLNTLRKYAKQVKANGKIE